MENNPMFFVSPISLTEWPMHVTRILLSIGRGNITTIIRFGSVLVIFIWWKRNGNSVMLIVLDESVTETTFLSTLLTIVWRFDDWLPSNFRVSWCKSWSAAEQLMCCARPTWRGILPTWKVTGRGRSGSRKFRWVCK